MNTPLTKVTIVTEAILKDKIIELVKRHGATGHTITKVEGEGSRGVRASDWEGRNVKLETILRKQDADAITSELNSTYFEDYAVIAWLSEVTVIRGAKFATED
jgi:nitrogen regulatory protein PII